MGSNSSKPGPQEWKASGPPQVSNDVLNALTHNEETDASRSRLIEQHIQARVAAELKKLQKSESDALKLAHDKIAEATPEELGEGRTSFAVGKDVEDLRRKLDERKKVRELPESVETSRSKVIQCLREHDRRPLDCWQEVEDFKAEVRKLEKNWVDKVTA